MPSFSSFDIPQFGTPLDGYLGQYAAYIPFAIGGFVLFMVIAVLMLAIGGSHQGVLADDIEPVSRSGYKPRRQSVIPFDLGNVTLDLQPKIHETFHTAIGGRTRLGKSTCVLPLLDLECGVLVIALDNTRPIAERIRMLPNGVEWTNEPNWPIGLDFLQGDARIVSEVLVEGWSSRTEGDTGKWRRIARDRLWTKLEQLDSSGIPRTLADLSFALSQKTGAPEIDRACTDWANRLIIFERSMGASLGHDLDLVQAMRDRKKVLLRVNPYLNPLDSPMVAGMLLVHARRCAQEANTPFVLIIEEAGQMSNYAGEMIPLAQASADRGVPLVIITQNLSKLPSEVANNIANWVSFAQEDKHEMTFIAHKLRLEPKHLWTESFPGKGEQQARGWCYVRGTGVSTRLVHIQNKKFVQPKALPIPSIPRSAPVSGNRWTIREIPMINHWQPWQRSLPGPESVSSTAEPIRYESAPPKSHVPEWVGRDQHMQRFWTQMRPTGKRTPLWSPERGTWWDDSGCFEWWGPLSREKDSKKLGRPRSNIGRASVTVYVETARAAGRVTLLTWDHCCDNPVCCNPDHLEEESRTKNNSNRVPRTDALEAAWLKEYGQIPRWWQERHYRRVGTPPPDAKLTEVELGKSPMPV